MILKTRRTAVVLGASMAGLLTARVLADVYDEVVLVERDRLPETVQVRRGIPQGLHLHAVLARGLDVLESMFPGLVDELVELGAPRSRFLNQARFVFSGHELARGDSGSANIQPTRAALDLAVSRRVRTTPGVRLLDDCVVLGPCTEGDRVVGVRVRPGAGGEQVIDADLVVDALGRGGRAARWLADLGMPPPVEERIRCDVTYASRFLHLPVGALTDQMVIVGPTPSRPRVLALAAHEGQRWMLTLGGMAGERPPTEEPGFGQFARSVAPPDVADAIADASPLTPVRRHRFPASIRRRYERLADVPEGLLVIGDALCSFNPVYGQGITAAALQAQELGRCLQDGTADLPRRFFGAAAAVVDPPWQLAAGGDLTVPSVPGSRPLSVRMMNSYIARLHRAAATDPALAARFMRVTGLIDPPSALLRPGTVAKVMLGRHTG